MREHVVLNSRKLDPELDLYSNLKNGNLIFCKL